MVVSREEPPISGMADRKLSFFFSLQAGCSTLKMESSSQEFSFSFLVLDSQNIVWDVSKKQVALQRDPLETGL